MINWSNTSMVEIGFHVNLLSIKKYAVVAWLLVRFHSSSNILLKMSMTNCRGPNLALRVADQCANKFNTKCRR